MDPRITYSWRSLSLAGVMLFFLLLFMTIKIAESKEPNARTGLITPITETSCQNMKNHQVMGPTAPIECGRLKLVKFSYFGFDNQTHDNGEIVVMDAAAKYVLRIFTALLRKRFPIAKANLLDQYDGDDDASMRDNNTSGFNNRRITDGTSISLHAYGLAIDLNPVQNPYLLRSEANLAVKPPTGAEYVNRLNDRPWKSFRRGMAEEVVDIFADNGFLIWGGYWDNPIDYQHFQVGRETAKHLAGLIPQRAELYFDNLVHRYRICRQTSAERSISTRRLCIMKIDPVSNSAPD